MAELIDPGPVRRLATIETPVGRHTLPVEDGEPVLLDPRVPRNALHAGLFRLEPGPVQLRPSEAVDWVAGIAEEPARQFRNGLGRVRNARKALRGVLLGRPMAERAATDVAFTLTLAGEEAKKFGPRGEAVAKVATRALSEMDQRALGAVRNAAAPWAQTRRRMRTTWPSLSTVSALARVGGRLGYRVGLAALRAKLAEVGVSPVMLDEIEGEMNREGLTLGALAAPSPMPGSLGALTTDALVGRWLASRAA